LSTNHPNFLLPIAHSDQKDRYRPKYWNCQTPLSGYELVLTKIHVRLKVTERNGKFSLSDSCIQHFHSTAFFTGGQIEVVMTRLGEALARQDTKQDLICLSISP
jgi:hypothetical protein